MHRLLSVLVTIGCLTILPDAPAQTNVLAKIDRALVKEPKYEATPKYSLLVLASSGSVKVWMVEEGRRLFVDRNANGDLTDDGPPIQPGNVRNIGALTPGNERWDFNYLLDAITPVGGPRHTDFDLRRWNYGGKEDSYGLSLSVLTNSPFMPAGSARFGPQSPRRLRSYTSVDLSHRKCFE